MQSQKKPRCLTCPKYVIGLYWLFLGKGIMVFLNLAILLGVPPPLGISPVPAAPNGGHRRCGISHARTLSPRLFRASPCRGSGAKVLSRPRREQICSTARTGNSIWKLSRRCDPRRWARPPAGLRMLEKARGTRSPDREDRTKRRRIQQGDTLGD